MPEAPLASRPARWTFAATAVVTFLAVCLGSIVCATDASAACPNWPGCYVGGVLPKGHLHPVVEFVHRVCAMSTAPLIIATGVLAARSATGRLLRTLPWVALVGALAAGVFGMMIIKFSLPMPLAVLDLVLSLVALVATVVGACIAWRGAAPAAGGPARLAFWVVAGLLLLHGLGIPAAGRGSFTRCMGWPMLTLVHGDSVPMQWLRWVLAPALAAALVWLAWQVRWVRPSLGSVGVAPVVLLALEITLGLTMRGSSTLGSKAAYAVVAVLVVAATALVGGMLLTPRPEGQAARR